MLVRTVSAPSPDPSPERKRAPFSTLGQALKFYTEVKARLSASRSILDVLQDRCRLGATGPIQGGRGSVREDLLVLVASIGRCLPSSEGLAGKDLVEATVAREVLLLTCGGVRNAGLPLADAAAAVRAQHGDHWTYRRCERLLYRAEAETRGALAARGLLPQRWASTRKSVSSGKNVLPGARVGSARPTRARDSAQRQLGDRTGL
jgi:hypothetical protein